MPTPVLVVLLSLICPVLTIIVGEAAVAIHPNMSPSGGMLLKLAIFIGSALAISFLFVRRERRGFSFGELCSVVGLCLAWTLALDYPRLVSIVSQSAETAGFHGVAATLGLAVALNLFMLHVAFGVVGRRFAEALLKRFEIKASVGDV